eukprot:NODE_6884_length_484_cov_70.680460_g6088_i0.p1 GENE.NODE_6884_length_484_cov_70.680460_g6088_i0~~NODE_6884_length_484_cov_70.680460_g6088_i0.p1  ORF type:complete len:143 (-),score=39.98 NODE_6884_length_484_cov_70.680460_g6088_i0:55-438(-)
MELSDVQVEPLVSPEVAAAPSVEEFYQMLEKEDHVYEGRRAEAAAKGHVLRSIGTFEGGKASVRLASVGPEHPAYGLTGANCVAAFTTERYPSDSPLVIMGPGAGGAVTAAGVLSDILLASGLGPSL